MRVPVVYLTCKRCGHRWIPRKEEVRICPKCKSPYWDLEKEKYKNKNILKSE